MRLALFAKVGSVSLIGISKLSKNSSKVSNINGATCSLKLKLFLSTISEQEVNPKAHQLKLVSGKVSILELFWAGVSLASE
jgi:hypothetical protein